jgi:hypothetical protein
VGHGDRTRQINSEKKITNLKVFPRPKPQTNTLLNAELSYKHFVLRDGDMQVQSWHYVMLLGRNVPETIKVASFLHVEPGSNPFWSV